MTASIESKAKVSTRKSRALRTLVYLLGAICVTGLALAMAALLIVRASLPQLDGERIERSLGAAVRVERDALGVVSLSGTSRDDLAYATGFVHAQDRFFDILSALKRLSQNVSAARPIEALAWM